LLFIAVSAEAQHPWLKWQSTPSVHSPREENKAMSAVILEDARYHEYKTDAKQQMFVTTEHRRLIKVNDDNGVESFNKIYIFKSPNAVVEKIMARAILPGGKVINLPENKIFDVEEEGRNYKKFAMEGLEKGSEIEYYARIKYPVYTFGIEYFSMSGTPIEMARFALSVPEHLVFDVKGYNGFTVGKDTVLDKQRIIYGEASNIPDIREEKYSSRDPYLTNVQYKLSYNLAKDKGVRINTWSELGKNVYNNYHSFSDKEINALDNFAKKIRIPDGAGPDEKISAIEDYIKTNINIEEGTIGDDGDKIEKIVKSKIAGHFGVTRLMIGVFERNGITPQLVFPSKRNEAQLDENFENFRLVDEVMLQFPETGLFLDPVDISFRYPVVNPLWTGTKGIFIRGTSIGNFKTALAEFDTIPSMPYEQSATNLNLHMWFNKTNDTMEMKSKQILTGHNAASYRPIFAFVKKDKINDVLKDIIKNVGSSDSVTNITYENSAMTDAAKNLPLNIMGDIKSVAILEKAGNSILVKVGEVIGTQVQMYQEKERQLPIQIQFPHALDRNIIFDLPEGYRVKNLSDLEFNVTDETKSMGFISTYKLEGKKLTIQLHEFYKKIDYPVNQIDIFKRVINAAADFNKVTLVLEKI
ncbi:MAG: DUF3857 domain-containing protein, partial [Chitinophagaceae bacterium]